MKQTQHFVLLLFELERKTINDNLRGDIRTPFTFQSTEHDNMDPVSVG